MPLAAVYRASLPMGMAIPPAPWSPRPRIRSLSVTTMSRTSSYGPWRRRVGMRSRSAGVIQVAAGPPDDVAEFLDGAARPSACRRWAGTPRGARRGAGRRGSRCGPGARPSRCSARAHRPCGGGARARARSARRWSGRGPGSRPRSRNASRSSSLKARSLVSSRLPRSAGPASEMAAGRPAAMSSYGAGRGRIPARIAGGGRTLRPRRTAADSAGYRRPSPDREHAVFPTISSYES